MTNNKAKKIAQRFIRSLQQLDDADTLTRELILRELGIPEDEERIAKCRRLTFDQVFLINKFMETPLETLVHGLK